MKKQRLFVGLFVAALALVLVGLSSPAAAQSPDEELHTAHQYSRSELINFGTYDEPPVSFEWETLDVRQEPVDDRLDYVFTVDVDLPTAIEFFESAYTEQTTAATLDPSVRPFQKERDLKIVGRSKGVDPPRFTLGGQAMTGQITIDVSQEAGQTIIIVKNMVRSRVYSGLVPSRAGFMPASAKPVPLLWN
ncbi:MAG: hypothetical protein ACLFVJ_05120 [Persicimonas sp.]